MEKLKHVGIECVVGFMEEKVVGVQGYLVWIVAQLATWSPQLNFSLFVASESQSNLVN